MNLLKELFSSGNYYFNPYALPSFIVGSYCFFLGIYVWARNKRMLGFSLFTLTFPTAIWLLTVGMALLSKDMLIAYYWYKICYAWVSFISVGSLFISLHLTGKIEIKKEREFLLIGYLVMAFFAFIDIYTDKITVYPGYRYYWGIEARAGGLLSVYLFAWIIFAFRATYAAYKSFKQSTDPFEKKKLRIFLYTYLLGYLAALDYFGEFGIGIYPGGYLFAGIYISLLAYNMIKYRAFEIDTVIHKTILWLVSIFLIILPAGIITFFFSKGLQSILPAFLNIMIFSAILVSFAYYYFYLRPKIDYLFGKKEFAYYELLGRISEKVSTTLDIEELALRLLNEMDSCIAPQKIRLWLLNEKGLSFFAYATKKPFQEPQIHKDQKETLSDGDPLITQIKNSKNIVELSLMGSDPRIKLLENSPALAFMKKEEIEIAIPISTKEGIIGILGLGKKRSFRIYTTKDIEALKTLARELGISIYNALHHKDIMEKEMLTEELRLARQIQVNLMPEEIPQIPGIKIRGVMKTAKEIGGDYYDFITMPQKEELAVAIGDVSGKGLGAGLIMATAKATLKGLSQQGLSPMQILTQANKLLYEYSKGQKFMTLLYLIWQSRTKTLTYSSAGHEHILVYRAFSNDIETIMSGGFMLGIIPDIENFLQENQILLNSKDKILLYTDGVTEAENSYGERFGLERLKESFKTHSPESPEGLIDLIKNDIFAFIGTQPQYDDITLVGLEAE